MRDYGKVHSKFWSSSTIGVLSDDGRMLALYLMTSPHTTIAGVFRLPDGYACEDLAWTAERVIEGFRELSEKGFADRCETTKWVWIRLHLKWNPPENPNQKKAAAKCAVAIPSECAWKPDFMRDWAEFLGLDPGENGNACETLPEPFANQEQEQEQKKDQKLSSSGDDPKARGLEERVAELTREAIETWNESTLVTDCGLASVRASVGFDKRKGQVRRMLRTAREICQEQFGAQTITRQFWVGLWKLYAKDDFFAGRVQGGRGHENWRPDFEFLTQEKNVLKLYDRVAPTTEARA